jgi:hypothetical protein
MVDNPVSLQLVKLLLGSRQLLTAQLAKREEIGGVWCGPDRIGLLGKPPASAASLNLQEPVAVLAFLHSPHLNAGMKQYECGLTQPLLRMSHDREKTSGQNLQD